MTTHEAANLWQVRHVIGFVAALSFTICLS